MLSAQQLTTILNAALQKLWANDASLFVDGNEKPRTIHERTVVAKLFHYLHCDSQKHLDYINNKLTWDFEYNRQQNNDITSSECKQFTPKELHQEETHEWKRIFPDLILHKRNKRINCCVIEVKCNPSSSLKKDRVKKDFSTLRGMLKMPFDYHFAIELIISRNKANLIWLTKDDNLSAITTTITRDTKLNLTSVKSDTQSILLESPYAYYTERDLPKCVKEVINDLCQEQKFHLLSNIVQRND